MREAFSYRDDPAVPAFADDRPVIVFDGKCVLCSHFAQFVLRHDPEGRFRLLAAQTSLGTALYKHFGLDPVNYDSNILLENGRIWLRSDSSIRIFLGLGFPWSLAAVALALPRFIRDPLYDIVARNRLRWFGTRETCFLPDPAQADRFLM